MPTEIISSLIDFSGTIIASIIAFISLIYSRNCKKQRDSYKKGSFVRFLSQEENFKDILAKVKTISSYTVNSHEIYNKLNTILEQNSRMSIGNVTLLVRKKANETSEDSNILNRNIELWKRLVRENKIQKLTIIAYDHDPDHYYTILGNRLMFCGQVLFAETIPTGTKVDYTPLVFDNSNKLGKQVIKNYQLHFDNIVQKYQAQATLFDSKNSENI